MLGDVTGRTRLELGRKRGFRVRYAGSSPVGAARERYRASGLFIPADHTDHHLVRLVAMRSLRVFDLRAQRSLDVLDLDDQVSTGQLLADRADIVADLVLNRGFTVDWDIAR